MELLLLGQQLLLPDLPARQCEPGVGEKLSSPNLLWSFDVAAVLTLYYYLPHIHLQVCLPCPLASLHSLQCLSLGLATAVAGVSSGVQLEMPRL